MDHFQRGLICHNAWLSVMPYSPVELAESAALLLEVSVGEQALSRTAVVVINVIDIVTIERVNDLPVRNPVEPPFS